jgi:hypothetical protein
MSSRCRLARLIVGLFVGVEVTEYGAGNAPFEAAQSFSRRVPGRQPLSVIVASWAVETDLGHRNAVQGGVELAVT